MSQKIKIFIASSGELAAERKSIWELTAEVGKLYPNLHLDPFEWEIDLPNGSVRADHIQAEINPKLAECDVVFVLFYSKVGAFTVEELRLAVQLEKKVFVYFKKGFSPETDEESERHREVLQIAQAIETDNRILRKKYEEGGLKEIYQMDLAKHLADCQPRTIRELPAHQLTFGDLDIVRQLDPNPVKRAYYFSRKSDDLLRQALADPSKKIVLLKGQPLAGKTRTCVEALRALPDRGLLIPDAARAEHWRLSAADAGKLLILNDFDLYVQQAGAERINQLLLDCTTCGVRVLATCKTGPEYHIAREAVQARHWENVTELEARALHREEFREIETFFKKEKIPLDDQAYQRLNYCVGSLFLPLAEMRRRYQRLQKETEGLPCAILQTLKAFWLGYNLENDGAFSRKKIKTYIHRFDDNEHSLAKWRAAFARLEISDTGDAFVRYTDDGDVLIEDAYFRVVINDIADWKYREEIDDLFGDPRERTEFGFYGVRYWTIRLNDRQAIRSLTDGLALVDEMRSKGVAPNTVTFTSLIPLCKTLGEGFSILEKMETANVERNTVTFNSLIPLCKTLGEGFSILEKMETANVERNTVTFTSLIQCTQQPDDAKAVFQKMLDAQQRPNIVTISTLLRKCGRDCAGIGWVESVRTQHGIALDDFYAEQLAKLRRRLACPE
jgi:hypothetical protein